MQHKAPVETCSCIYALAPNSALCARLDNKLSCKRHAGWAAGAAEPFADSDQHTTKLVSFTRPPPNEDC